MILRNVSKRTLALFLAAIMVFLLLPLSPINPIKSSAVSVDGFSVDGLEVDYTGDNSYTVETDGTNGLVIKATTTGSGCDTKKGSSATITMTNKLDGEAVLSFACEQSGEGGQVDVGSTTKFDAVSYSVTLAAGDSLTVKVSTPATEGNNRTFKMSGISLISTSEKFNVTVEYEETLGSVKCGDTVVDNGFVANDVSPADGVTLVATPASGAAFFAWVDSATGLTLSPDATYTCRPTGNVTVKAVFTKTDGSSTAWFSAGTAAVLYDDLNKAIAAAQQASAEYVVLKSSGILAAGTYTIPANIKLLIPYDVDNTHSGSDPDTEKMPSSGWLTPEPFRTLTMADGAVIKVENKASIEVAANHYASHGGKDFGGRPVHYYGHIVMQGQSRIELESGANLYAWGYITGSTEAKVIAKSGSTIYEKMQVADYRGGSATTPITSAGVFPFSQYYIQNVEVKEVIQSGANLICHAAIYAYSIQNNTVNFMGADSGNSSPMFALGADSQAVKYYDPTTDRLIVDVSGSFSFNSISLMGYNTQNFVLPLQQNLTINIKSGAVATVNQDIMLQPGCQINIDNGATLKVASGKNVHLMDTAEWGTFCSASPRQLVQITYVPSTSNKLPVTRTLNNDAKVDVNGTVIIEGQIYASAGHASIVSSGKTGVITFTSAVNATTSIKQCKTNDKNGVFEIPMYSAVLTNTDGTTVDTTGTAAGTTYYSHCGIWQTGEIDAAKAPTCTGTGLTEGSHCSVCGETLVAQTPVDALGHNYDAVVTAPTCTEKGFTTHTCSRCGDSYIDSEIDALGHNYDAVVTAPTCTEKGFTTHTCSRCGDSYTDSETNALGHNYSAVVTDPTCTEKGYTTYTCACGHSYTADEVEAKGHSYDEGVVTTEPTCEAEGVKTYTCANCGDTKTEAVEALGHDYEAVVTAPTCTEKGYTTYTCACGHSYTADEVEAKGHSYDEGVVTTKPTCEADGVKTFTCANCGDTYTEVVTSPGHNYDAVVTAPTCTKKGYTTHTCSACGNSYTDTEIDALDHNYDAVVTAPTCTEKGFTTHTCSRCGDSYIDSETDALGHSFEHGECVCGDVKLGDTNGDGDVTTSDVGILNAFVLGKISLSEEQLILADVNGDGKITTADVALLNAYALGKIQL